MYQYNINITKAKIKAFHGYYKEERSKGGWFYVSVYAFFSSNFVINSFEKTVDYCKIYEIVQEEMTHAKALMETVAGSIIDKIRAEFNFLKKITVTIEKETPPIPNFNGQASITIEKEYY